MTLILARNILNIVLLTCLKRSVQKNSLLSSLLMIPSTRRTQVFQRRVPPKKHEGGAVNKISIAFNCIGKPNLVEGNIPYDLSNEVVEEEDEAASSFITEVLTLTEDDMVLPSELLSNERWVKFVMAIFELEKLDISGTVDQEMKDKADLLVKLLQERYKDYVKKRIKTVSRRTHWSMKLAYKNLVHPSAWMSPHAFLPSTTTTFFQRRPYKMEKDATSTLI